MTKAEAIAYLRKKQLLERIADTVVPDIKPEAAEELDALEKSSEKELTTEGNSV